jgi:hypothetical protein
MRTILFLAVVLALVPAAQAQQRPRVAIEFVRIGFPAGLDSTDAVGMDQSLGTLFKSGLWTPVYVTIRAGAEGTRPGRVVVEATDSDDVQNTYAVPVPALEPNDTVTVQAFTKTGSVNGDLIIRLDDQVAENRFKTVIEQKKSFNAIGMGDPLCLAVGSRISGLRQNLAGLFPPGQGNQANLDRLRVAFVDDVGSLPDRWFGYAPVDLMILTTGKREFVNGLLGEDRHRKEALAEWVRRGGHLLVSCGRNQDTVPDLFNRAHMPLPVNISELHVPAVEGLRAWLPVGTETLHAPPARNGVGGTIILAKLEPKPGMSMQTILPESSNDKSPPLIVRWPYGLGQITLVAFDLDQPPFTTWNGQKDFWRRLLEKLRLKPVTTEAKPPANNMYVGQDNRADLASLLQTRLENFKDVSVISFGWVALFILIYIVIVGPLDYLFLKKVVKRLELTWITFPTVVILVSAIAYFAAYSLKGNDLRINKVDLVDIDLGSRQVLGNTWFTVFSPRIQLYTVGIEPAAPLFAAEDATAPKPAAPVVVSWMGKPDEGYAGYNRARSQSLFHRTYRYAPDAAGLRDVPIQVWSSKSFTANWEGSWTSNQRQGLQYEADTKKLAGTVTNPLPVPLEDVAVIYGEGQASRAQVHVLGRLNPGQSRPIPESTQPMSNWRETSPVVVQQHYGPYQNLPTVPSSPLMKQILFYSATNDPGQARDTALRYLDQSWRQNLKDVAILYGRVATQDGPAEAVTQSAATPTRLWLGELPGTGASRPRLDGMLNQETYVRVFIPVPPAPAKDNNK